MKVMFVLQYFPYQYEQFKPLVDELGADAFYRIHTDSQTKYYNSKIFDVSTGSPVHYKDIPQDKYDCVVYTGTWCESLLKFADKCKYKNIVCMSHSLIGSLYDIGIVTAAHPRAVGLVPRCWTGFSSFEKRKGIVRDEGGSAKVVYTTTHPIQAQALRSAPLVRPDSNTLGVILGHKSPMGHFSKIVDDLVKRFKFDEVRVKLHPLTEESIVEEFWSKGYIKVLPQSARKYEDWLDRCSHVIGGCSSLLVESVIRSGHFSQGQFFKQFPFQRRGIPLDIEGDQSGNWSTCSNVFSDFTSKAEDVLKEHKSVLESIIDGTAELEVIE